MKEKTSENVRTDEEDGQASREYLPPMEVSFGSSFSSTDSAKRAEEGDSIDASRQLHPTSRFDQLSVPENVIRRRKDMDVDDKKQRAYAAMQSFDSSMRSMCPQNNACKRFETISYELVDTPVWSRRKVKMLAASNDTCMGCEDEKNGRSNGMQCAEKMCSLIYYVGDLFLWAIDKNIRCRRTNAADTYFRNSRICSRLGIASLGIVIGSVGFLISLSAETLLLLKIQYATGQSVGGLEFGLGNYNRNDGDENDENLAVGYVIHLFLSVFAALVAIAPVALRPCSGGSGIAEAKAVLNGIVLPGCTDLISAFAKGLSVIFASAASLPVGLEGPLIFIGLSIGENAFRLIPKRYSHLRSERYRRDLAAVGTTCGVSAGFLAPIGAVLFALEEGCSFWSTNLAWMCFAASCMAVVVSYLWSTIIGGSWKQKVEIFHLAKFNGIEGQLGNYDHPTFAMWEYLAFAVVGLAGGVLGAIFVELSRKLAKCRRKIALTTRWKCLEVVGLTAIMSSLIWWLPTLSTNFCGSFDYVTAEKTFFRTGFGCSDGEYNQLATLLLNPPGSVVINLLFWEEKEVFSVSSCLIAGAVYYIMVLLLFGATLGMGIFIPFLYVGACFGRAAAIGLGLVQFKTYAIVGSVAMLAGVTRVLVSLTAIMTQTTALPFFVTPFMVTAIVSKVVGKWCFGRGGIYDTILALKGIPFLEETLPLSVRNLDIRASGIMSPKSVTLQPKMQVCDVLSILKSHSHSDYPVVDPSSDNALIGIISREHLITILKHPEKFYFPSDDAPKKPITFDQLIESDIVVREKDAIMLPEEECIKYVNLLPYAQIGPHAINSRASAERAYEIFRTLGLRNLPVVSGPDLQPVGYITRYDLKILEELDMDDEQLLLRKKSVGEYDNIS